jgi:hypothetical protein
MIASGSFKQEIDDIVDAYDGNPAKMEEDVRLSGDMKLTMALQQKVKEIEAQERGATLDTPVPTNTIKDQLADKYYNNNAPSQGETASNVGGVNANIMQKEAMKQPLAANPTASPTTNPTSSGIASLNPNLFGGGMARGGIVSFDDGGDVEGNNTISPEEMAEIDASEEYKNSLLPKSPEELTRMLDNLQELIEQSPPEDREQYRPALEALAEELQNSISAAAIPTDQEAGLQSEIDSLVALKEKYPDDPRVEEIFARSKLRDSMEGSPLNPGPRSEERVELPDSRPRERSGPDYIRPPITSETRIPTENAELAELEAAVSGVNKGRAEDFITDARGTNTQEAPESNPIDLERVKAAFTRNKSASKPGITKLVGDYPTKTMRQPTNNPSGSAEELVNAMTQKEAAYDTAGEPPISVGEVEAEMKNPDGEPAMNAALTDAESVVTDPESNIARFDAAMKESRRLTANDSIDRAFPDEPEADEDLVVTQIKETLEEQAKEYKPLEDPRDSKAYKVGEQIAEDVEWIADWTMDNPADAISLGLGALSGIGFAKGATKALWKQLNTAKTREQIAKAARASGKFLQKLYTKEGPGGKIDSNVSSLLQDGTKRVFDPTRAALSGAVISQGIGALVGDDDSKKGADGSLTPEQINAQAMSSVAAAFPDEKTGGGIEALTGDGAADDGSNTPTAVTADGVLKGSSTVSIDVENANDVIADVATVINGKGEGEAIKVNKDGEPILSAQQKTTDAQQKLADATETFNTDIETEREAQATTVANEVKALEDRLTEQMERRRSKSIIARMIAFGGAGSFAEGATNSGIRGLAYDKEMDAFENESFAKIRAAKSKIRDDKIAGIKERYEGNIALQNLYIGIARTEYDFGIAAENTAFKLAELKLQGIEIRQKDFSNTTMNTYYTGLLSNAITAQSDLRIKTNDANLLAQIDLLANINVKNLGNLMKIKADIDALPSANSTKATTLNEQLEKAIEKFSESTSQIEDLIDSNPDTPTSI